MTDPAPATAPILSRRALLSGVTGVAALGLGPGLLAAPARAQVATLGYAEWVKAFYPRAQAKGVSEATYFRVLNGLKPDTSVYALDKSQPEAVRPIWDYLDKAVSEWRITKGRQRLEAHKPLFDRIEATYGVDRAMLCALWGMESAFGESIADRKWMRPILPALAALAWGEPRRRPYWEGELVNALVIIEKGWAKPEDMVGSWAGAMGHTQWMPEVWLTYGHDFDGDGRITPFGRPDDGLAGTAKYLQTRGQFRPRETWGYEVALAEGFDLGLADVKTERGVAEWQGLGIARPNAQPFARVADRGKLWLPAGRGGPAFLLLPNFYAIRSYNPSNKYALAIGHLADRIRGGATFVQAWPKKDKVLSTAEVSEMQQRLAAKGFYPETPDGKIGDKTQEAVREWQKAVGIAADGYPTDAVLRRLRGS